ncbi:MAG: hydroxyethylthiazole kinase [Butyricicoccus pullicaecorum]|nr:hydroxyethylthiazole kinase [Butyricicoccus pullicaecorum]
MELTSAVCALIDRVRTQIPIIHCMTNLVTINDCANAILAVGGSPIMADAPEESDSITSHAKALVLNIGQLSPRKLDAMLRSGKQASHIGIPIILDPVGVGASPFRAHAVRQILECLPISILRCNRAEAACIYGLPTAASGIDSNAALSVADGEALAFALANRFSCTVAITGSIDILADTQHVYRLAGGHEMLSRVTGMGCVSSVLCGTYAAVSESPLTAALAALGMISAAGECAYQSDGQKGTGSFHIAVMDALSRFSAQTLRPYLKITEVSHAKFI